MQDPELSSSQRSKKVNTTPPALQIVNTVENKYLLPTNQPIFFPRTGNSIYLLVFQEEKVFKN